MSAVAPETATPSPTPPAAPMLPAPGETIVWQGRPHGWPRWRWAHLGFVPLAGVVIGLLVLAWVTAVEQLPVMVPVALLLIDGLIVLMVVMQLYRTSRHRARQRYVMTDKRALILLDGQQHAESSLSWLDVAEISKWPRWTNGGTLIFRSPSRGVAATPVSRSEPTRMEFDVLDLEHVDRMARGAQLQARRAACAAWPALSADAELAAMVRAEPPRGVTPAQLQRWLRGSLGADHYLAAALMVAVGSVLIAFVFPRRIGDQLWLDWGSPRQVQALVIDLQPTGWSESIGGGQGRRRRSGDQVYRVRFRFQPQEGGPPILGTSYLTASAAGRAVRAGRPGRANYLPHDPRVNCLVGARVNRFSYASAVSLLVPAAGVALGIRHFLNRRHALRSLRDGWVHPARVTRVEPRSRWLGRWGQDWLGWRVELTVPADGMELPAYYLADHREAWNARIWQAGARQITILCDTPIPQRVLPVDQWIK